MHLAIKHTQSASIIIYGSSDMTTCKYCMLCVNQKVLVNVAINYCCKALPESFTDYEFTGKTWQFNCNFTGSCNKFKQANLLL